MYIECKSPKRPRRKDTPSIAVAVGRIIITANTQEEERELAALFHVIIMHGLSAAVSNKVLEQLKKEQGRG